MAWQRSKAADPRLDLENEVAETVGLAWDRFGDDPCVRDVTRWSRKVLSRRVQPARHALRLRTVTDHRVETLVDAAPNAEQLAEAREWIDTARAMLAEGERHTFDLIRQGVTTNTEIAEMREASLRCVEKSRLAVRRCVEQLSGSFPHLCG